MLTSNHFVELADLDVLGTFGRLTHLVLLDNPVTKKEVWSSFCYFSQLWLKWSLKNFHLALPIMDHLEVPISEVL